MPGAADKVQRAEPARREDRPFQTGTGAYSAAPWRPSAIFPRSGPPAPAFRSACFCLAAS